MNLKIENITDNLSPIILKLNSIKGVFWSLSETASPNTFPVLDLADQLRELLWNHAQCKEFEWKLLPESFNFWSYRDSGYLVCHFFDFKMGYWPQKDLDVYVRSLCWSYGTDCSHSGGLIDYSRSTIL